MRTSFDKYSLKDFVREPRTPLDSRTTARKFLNGISKNAIKYKSSRYGIFSYLSMRDFIKFTFIHLN